MRTEMSGVDHHENGKWSITFTTYVGTPGSERVLFESVSSPIYDTEDEAYISGERIMDDVDDSSVRT